MVLDAYPRITMRTLLRPRTTSCTVGMGYRCVVVVVVVGWDVGEGDMPPDAVFATSDHICKAPIDNNAEIYFNFMLELQFFGLVSLILGESEQHFRPWG